MSIRSTLACTLAFLCTLALAATSAPAFAAVTDDPPASAQPAPSGQDAAKPDAKKGGYVEAKAVLRSSAPRSCNRTLTGYGFVDGCSQAACETARAMARADLEGKIVRGGGTDDCFQYILVQPCVFTGCLSKTKGGDKPPAKAEH